MLFVVGLPGALLDGAAANVAPTAAFSANPTDRRVDFIDLSTDADGTIVGWLWDFGDGSGTSTSQNPSYTYGSDGTRTVSLTVTDNNGATGSTSRSVTVAQSPSPAGGLRDRRQMAALRYFA